MRCLERNKTAFYFALFVRGDSSFDSSGYRTGETIKIYGKPVKCRANISPATGETIAQQFGGNESYDKVIVLDNTSIPIDEYSILWVDVKPVIKPDGTTDTPHDYIVKKIAKSLNSVSVAISKVNVNAV